MLVSHLFRGTELELDDQLFYYAPMDYWVAFNNEGEILFGLNPAASVKEGGFCNLEFTVQEGDKVKAGEVIAVAVTAKIKYLEALASGTIVKLNKGLEQNRAGCFEKMDLSWLALISMESPEEMLPLVDYAGYLNVLQSLEGYSLPPGVKGAGSPTCRSVYESIRK